MCSANRPPRMYGNIQDEWNRRAGWLMTTDWLRPFDVVDTWETARNVLVPSRQPESDATQGLAFICRVSRLQFPMLFGADGESGADRWM